MGLYDSYSSGGDGGGSGTLYGSYSGPKTSSSTASSSPRFSFGTIAHSFLSGLAHAVAHPVQTIKNDVVEPVVDAGKSAYHDVHAATMAAGSMIEGHHGEQLAIDKKNVSAEFARSHEGKALGADKATFDKSGKYTGPGITGTDVRKAAGATLSDALNVGSILPAGRAAKEAVAADNLFHSLVAGSKIGAKYGTGFGAAQALQEDKFNPHNIARDVAEGAGGGLIVGGVLGGISHATGQLLTKAIHGWIGKTVESAHQVINMPEGSTEQAHLQDSAQLALPAPKSGGNLPARSVTNPVKKTAGPNGGVFGEFNDVSHETASQIMRLNHTLEAFNNEGEHVAPANRTVDTTQMGGGDAKDGLVHLSQIQTLRNQAALTMDSIAQDRADMLRSTQKEAGGTHIVREDGQVTKRGSSNDNFYRSFYKANGKPPTKADWLQEAHRQLTTSTDEQAQHYQQASKIAEAAHQAYLEKVATFKHSDLYAPKVTEEQAAKAKADLPAAEAKAGAERIDGQQPQAVVQPKPAEDASTLITRLQSIDEGKSKASKLKTLNDLIQHPDISNEDKAKFVAQRDMLRPSAKSKASQAEMTTTKNTEKTAPKAEITEKPAKTTSPEAADGVIGHDSDVKAAKGSRIERVYDSMVGKRGSGAFNPSRAASRQGNVGLARAATDLVSSKRLRTYRARMAAKELRNLMKGLNVDEVNRAIEGGHTDNKAVAEAAAFFRAHADAIGEQGVNSGALKGLRENYLPHVATGLESRRSGLATGLKKNTRYNIERQSIEYLDEHGSVVKEAKYKTIDEFDKAVQSLGGKAERDTSKLLEHLLTTEGHAVENARAVEKLADTRMVDGRPALVPNLAEKNLKDPQFKDYAIIDNKLVHPDAQNVYEAVTRTGKIDNPFGQALVKANSLGKRAVTLNGFFHAVNIWKSSWATQGVGKSLWAIVGKGAGQQDIERALGYGLKLARASSDNLFDEVGKQTGLTGKIEGKLKPLDELLFHKFGDRQGIMTYLTIEKKMLKSGLTADEAGRIAADQGNQVMHFVPEDQQAVAARQASQLFLFAGQFLQNTFKTGTNAFGVGLDRTLTNEGQRAAQKLAIERIARMAAYSFAAAQVINLGATGKFTWENGNGYPMDPVWYVKKGKDGKPDKQYRITNHYGQLKDLVGFVLDPMHEAENKLAPGTREVFQQLTGVDAFTEEKFVNKGDSKPTQIVDRLVHAATGMFSPAGINLKQYVGPQDQRVAGQPGVVQLARQLGVNSSSAKASDKNLDFSKLSSDKKAAQAVIDAYTAGDNSKLAAMQTLKMAGNTYFDKFFKEHPELDPTSQQFQGLADNNRKEESANIAAGFDIAKQNGTTLKYMQSIKESGNSYFDKFFAEHPDLDPTSEQFAGGKANTAASRRASSEAKYQMKAAKYQQQKFSKPKASVKTTTKSARQPSVKTLSGAKLKYTTPKKAKVVGGSLIKKRSKKSITGI